MNAEFPPLEPKYAVLKWKDWQELNNALTNEAGWPDIGEKFREVAIPIDDAVVIRRQDVFAPPALDAYANSMRIVLEGMDPMDMRRENLQDVADYFADQAAQAWLTSDRKLPD